MHSLQRSHYNTGRAIFGFLSFGCQPNRTAINPAWRVILSWERSEKINVPRPGVTLAALIALSNMRHLAHRLFKIIIWTRIDSKCPESQFLSTSFAKHLICGCTVTYTVHLPSVWHVLGCREAVLVTEDTFVPHKTIQKTFRLRKTYFVTEVARYGHVSHSRNSFPANSSSSLTSTVLIVQLTTKTGSPPLKLGLRWAPTMHVVLALFDNVS